MTSKIYDRPFYYDIAFTWSVLKQIDFFERIFELFVPFKVERIGEPACGTGRLLLALARRGYRVMGYDVNPRVVEYAKRRITEAGLADRAEVKVADMRSVVFNEKFGAAFNLINSLGYLHSDEEIVTHFRCTGDALQTGGVYVVQLSCAWGKPPEEDLSSWTFERNGVRVKTTWTVEHEDRERKLSHQRCRMEIEDNGRELVLDEPHVLRLWLYEDLRRLARESGRLFLTAIYDEKFAEVPLDAELTGELGNLYFVFGGPLGLSKTSNGAILLPAGGPDGRGTPGGSN